jgi:hypothetical protein
MNLTPETAFLALACVSGFSLALFAVIRWQGLMLGLLVMTTAFESTRDFALTSPVAPTTAVGYSEGAYYIRHSGNLFAVGSAQIHLYDVVTLLAVCAGLLGLRRFRGNWTAGTALLALLTMTAVGIVAFALAWGLQPSVNEWRRWTIALSILLFGTTTRRPWRWSDLNWIVASGLIAAALTAAEIQIHGLGSAYGWVYGGGYKVNGRPIAEDGALLMLVAAWALALKPGRWGSLRVAGLLTLVGFTVISEQRTMWLAGAASLAAYLGIWLLNSGRQIIKRVSWTVISMVFAGFALLIAFANSPQLQDSLNQTQTYQWRVARWQTSFGVKRSLVQWLTGGTFGPTPATLPGNIGKDIHGLYAHSLYVWAVESAGLAGAALLVVLIASLCFASRSTSPAGWPLVTGVIALTAGYSYGLPDWYWLPIAMSAGWLGIRQRQPVRSPEHELVIDQTGLPQQRPI